MNKYEYKNQLETLQELAHIGLWEFDLTTKTLTWSNEIYNIFEMDNKTFIPTYENFFKIVHPEDKELLENAYLNSLKTKERFMHISELPDSDAGVIPDTFAMRFSRV
ncbi:PAS domain-containing protein [Aliarcobacter butzleri]|uniref:PAS domain-containing protein n=1 Tax=Aliarcobacter butzleri TaxID=28197 RepID=UPI00125F0D51|nr:PAS domain-containing protein [Aliarcobacter butzleri]MCT7571491.1 PAS domain-containing protein [Aliarcobacter butzleri]MDK2091387.1 PAS domain-containing protein [Aliarcobacter butzleri]